MQVKTKFDIGNMVYVIYQNVTKVTPNNNGGYDCETIEEVKRGKIVQIGIIVSQKGEEIRYAVNVKDGWFGHMLRENELFTTKHKAEEALKENKDGKQD